MSNDDIMKKLQGLKDLRQAIDLIRNQELEKANPPTIKPDVARAEGKQAIAAQNMGQLGLKHMGVRTDKMPGVVSHMISIPGTGGNSHHYEIDANLSHMDSKIPAYTVHKIHSNTGHAIESAPKAFNSLSQAVKSLVSHATIGKWGQEE